MNEKQLLRVKNAALALGLDRTTFLKRRYQPDKIIDGVRFFDIERLKATPFIDKRCKIADALGVDVNEFKEGLEQ